MEQQPENIKHHDPEELEREINDLKEELEHFQKEKERVRAIVGAVGGVPKFNTKVANWIFTILIAVSLMVSVVIAGREIKLIMIEIAIVLISVKIIYLIHSLMKVNHFKFWMLSSIEWRLNELNQMVKDMKEGQDSEVTSSREKRQVNQE